MKRKLGSIIGLFLFCLVMMPHFSFAQEEMMDGEQMVMESPTPTVSITPTPDYPLPYPGLLPDSPLYFLKATRDRVIGFMISDSLKKADFNMLQADKRIGAAVILFDTKDRENQELAVSTVSKAMNYFEEALQKAREAKKQGESISEIKGRMKRADEMYVYLLQKAQKKSSSDIAQAINVELARLNQFSKQIKGL